MAHVGYNKRRVNLAGCRSKLTLGLEKKPKFVTLKNQIRSIERMPRKVLPHFFSQSSAPYLLFHFDLALVVVDFGVRVFVVCGCQSLSSSLALLCVYIEKSVYSTLDF